MGLTRQQVDLARRMMYLGPGETKERGPKRVPIQRALVPILEPLLKITYLYSDRVILLRDKEGIRPPTLEAAKNCWPRAGEKLGLEERLPRLHDLRHTWRTNARRSGMDPQIAESITGPWHKGRSVNDRYGRINDEELIRAIDNMTFDHGETEIWVPGLKEDRVLKKGNLVVTETLHQKKGHAGT